MRSVTLKSAITPSFIGRIVTMLPGVRPSMSFASFPTASTSFVTLVMATIEVSFTTTPLPFAYTSVFAVPRSIARSEEKRLNNERRFIFGFGVLAGLALPSEGSIQKTSCTLPGFLCEGGRGKGWVRFEPKGRSRFLLELGAINGFVLQFFLWRREL